MHVRAKIIILQRVHDKTTLAEYLGKKSSALPDGGYRDERAPPSSSESDYDGLEEEISFEESSEDDTESFVSSDGELASSELEDAKNVQEPENAEVQISDNNEYVYVACSHL